MATPQGISTPRRFSSSLHFARTGSVVLSAVVPLTACRPCSPPTELYLELDFDAFRISALFHPSTYLNKIVVGSQQGALQLWNIRTNALLYTFRGWKSAVASLEQVVHPSRPVICPARLSVLNGRLSYPSACHTRPSVLLGRLSYPSVRLSCPSVCPACLSVCPICLPVLSVHLSCHSICPIRRSVLPIHLSYPAVCCTRPSVCPTPLSYPGRLPTRPSVCRRCLPSTSPPSAYRRQSAVCPTQLSICPTQLSICPICPSVLPGRLSTHPSVCRRRPPSTSPPSACRRQSAVCPNRRPSVLLCPTRLSVLPGRLSYPAGRLSSSVLPVRPFVVGPRRRRRRHRPAEGSRPSVLAVGCLSYSVLPVRLSQAPAVDVAAIGLQNGRVLLHNLKYDETLMSFSQDWGPVICISFRTGTARTRRLARRRS